jgi:uncharacterized Fe-S cluster protein YjdI
MTSSKQHIRFAEPIVIETKLEQLLNAETCLHSQKRIRNNSVYCQHQDRGWISPKNCDACPRYKLDPSGAQAAPQEDFPDSTGPVRDEDGNAIAITQEDELEW